MAVYTELTEADIAQHLAGYDLGQLTAWHGIAQGVSNSNFYVETDQGRYILTLFEARTDVADLPFFMAVMQHLASQGIACPKPLAARDGTVIRPCKNRSAIIISFLQGSGVETVQLGHMAPLGQTIVRMHGAFDDFPQQRANGMGPAMWQQLADDAMPRADALAPGLADLIRMQLAHCLQHWPAADALPRGIIHADLFPDNVFFSDKPGDAALTGVIDFYFTCTDFYAYDLAIAINAWCFDVEGGAAEYNADRAAALLAAYQAVRRLCDAEKQAMPLLLRCAALRFLLTRTHDAVFRDKNLLVAAKDPSEYIQKITFWSDAGPQALHGAL